MGGDHDVGEDDGEDDGVMGFGTSCAITREFSSKWQLLANNLQMGSPFFWNGSLEYGGYLLKN